MTMLMSSRAAANASGTEVVQLLHRLDTDGNGVITVDEFKDSVRGDPRLLECFGRLFGVSEPDGNEEETKVCCASPKCLSCTNHNAERWEQEQTDDMFRDKKKRTKLGVLDLIRAHAHAERTRRLEVTESDETTDSHVERLGAKVRNKETMALAMRKFKRMSLPTMAVTVAALQVCFKRCFFCDDTRFNVHCQQGEMEDTEQRITFVGKSPAAMAARNYGAKLATNLHVCSCGA